MSGEVTLNQAEDLALALLYQVVADFVQQDGHEIAHIYHTDVHDKDGEFVNNPPTPEQTWLRAQFAPNDGFQASMGGGPNRYRRFGLLTVQVFTPGGQGKRANGAICQTLMRGFEGQAAGAVSFENVRTVEVGRSDAWFQQNVVMEWDYDDHH